MIVTSLCGGGCSTSFTIGSPKDDEKPLHTGSIANPAAAKPAVSAADDEIALPPEADLAFARTAASEVLAKGHKDASAPWENPRSGARGTVTPIASAYRVEGAVCHDFLASYVSGEDESWMQGEACRAAGGNKWEVRRLKPWRRT